MKCPECNKKLKLLEVDSDLYEIKDMTGFTVDVKITDIFYYGCHDCNIEVQKRKPRPIIKTLNLGEIE